MVAPSLVGTFKLALAAPTREPLTAASQTLLLQGAVFALVGLMIVLLSGRSSIAQHFEEKELAMFRIFGVLLLVVGWEYIEGARSNSRHFVAATIFLEVALLGPFFLVLQRRYACPPSICYTLAALYPALGVLTYVAWREAPPDCRGFFELVVGAAASEPLTPLHRCLQSQGAVYAVIAGAAVFLPGVYNATFVQLFGEAPIEGPELAMLRMVGALLLSVGYMFIQGAKENIYFFAASTIFGRLVLIPAVAVILILTAFSSLRRSIGVSLAVLDVLLALVAYNVWVWQDNGHKHSVGHPQAVSTGPSDGHPHGGGASNPAPAHHLHVLP